ncbi:MAG: phosphocholine cytidylyltransferase family protein [Desulfotomaculales bacterium]
MALKAVILAASAGTRLGNASPKCLTRLADGRTILEHQLDILRAYLGVDDILVVVGYKKESIMEAFPGLLFAYNERFNVTNTAKSLLRGLRKVAGNDVLWLNGDVVFEARVIERLLAYGRKRPACMCVKRYQTGEEEVKCELDEKGLIRRVSKNVPGGVGEAIGINYISSRRLDLFAVSLEECHEKDYFERGVELAIQKGLEVYPVDVSDLFCWEVDFPEDLDYVNAYVRENSLP